MRVKENINKFVMSAILVVTLVITSGMRDFAFGFEVPQKRREFEVVIEENKDNKENLEEIYLGYITGYFTEREFKKSIDLIDKFETKFTASKYVDDFMWFKVYILKYLYHQYPELEDAYLNLIEKYDGVKFDSKFGADINKIAGIMGVPVEKIKGKYDEFPTELKKEALEKEFKRIKELEKKIEELKAKTKEIEEEKDIKNYLEIGKLYREFFDFAGAEEWYLKGTKVNMGDVETGELFFEAGEMYKNDTEKLMNLPIGIKYTDGMKHYDFRNEQYKKALEYYLEAHKKYPESKFAPRALERAGELYATIGWEWGWDGETIPRLTAIDYVKAAECYENIWKHYPEYESGGKGLAEKFVILKMRLGDLKKSKKITEIAYYEKILSIDKNLISKYPHGSEYTPEEKTLKQRIKDTEETIKRLKEVKE